MIVRTAFLCLFLWDALFGGAHLAASEPGGESGQELVGRSIEYHGGELSKSTRTTLELCSKSGCSALDVMRDDGLYEYCATAKTKAGERRVCATNDRATQWLDGEPVIGGGAPDLSVHGDRETELRDWVMARVYFAFLPSRLDDPSVGLEDLGREDWDGRALRKVKVTFEAGTSTDAEDEFLYWFDPETARLEQFAYSYERNHGGIRFRKLVNYRRMDGILFFDQENYGADGPGLSVDLVSPEFFRDSMHHVSTVELKDVLVAPVRSGGNVL